MLSKVSTLDRFRYDTALAERNPFYKLMVDNTNKALLNAEARYLEVEKEVNRLINASRKSRPRTLLGRLVPQDKAIFKYLESTPETKKTLAKTMTKEELDRSMATLRHIQWCKKTQESLDREDNYCCRVRFDMNHASFDIDDGDIKEEMVQHLLIYLAKRESKKTKQYLAELRKED